MKNYHYRIYNGENYARHSWVQRWRPFIVAGVIAILLYRFFGDIIMSLWDLSGLLIKIMP